MSQGFNILRSAVYPYTVSTSSAFTYPVIFDDPSRLKAIDWFWGVKTTLKCSAVRLKLSEHRFRARDSMSSREDAIDEKEMSKRSERMGKRILTR